MGGGYWRRLGWRVGGRLDEAQAGYWQLCCGMPGQRSMQRGAGVSLRSVLWRIWVAQGEAGLLAGVAAGVQRRGGAVWRQDARMGTGRVSHSV
jgi:hypothetical protein